MAEAQNGASVSTRVSEIKLPDVSGAYLMANLDLAVIKDGNGLAVRLSPASARELAAELVRLAATKEPEA